MKRNILSTFPKSYISSYDQNNRYTRVQSEERSNKMNFTNLWVLFKYSYHLSLYTSKYLIFPCLSLFSFRLLILSLPIPIFKRALFSHRFYCFLPPFLKHFLFQFLNFFVIFCIIIIFFQTRRSWRKVRYLVWWNLFR